MTKGVYKYVLIVIFIVILSGCNPTNESDSVQLIVSLSATPEHVMIDNGNSYVWNNVKFTLNHNYIYESKIIPRGSTSLNLSEFVKPDGTSFDPKKQRFTSLSISVPNAIDGKTGVFKW